MPLNLLKDRLFTSSFAKIDFDALKTNAQDWLSDHNLACLWSYLPLVLLSWALFTILSGLSRHLGPFLFPSVFHALTPPELKKLRLSWPHHIVSLVHAIVISVLAIANVAMNELGEDRVWGFSEGISRMVAVTMGYFLWDLKVTIHYWHLYGRAFLIHAIMALSSFLFSYAPFAQFYAPYFLLFELSSIFVNVHWFMSKLNLNGSRLQKINDVILIVLFFVVRIVCGVGMTIFFIMDIWKERGDVSASVLAVYGTCLMATNTLNIYWFVKLMKQALGGVSLKGIKLLRRKQKALVDVHDIDMSSVSRLPESTGSHSKRHLHHRHRKNA